MEISQELINKKLNELVFENNSKPIEGIILENDEISSSFFIGKWHEWLSNPVWSLYEMNKYEMESLKEESETIFYESKDKVIDDLKFKEPFYYALLKRFILLEDRSISTGCTYWDEYMRKFVIMYNPDFVRLLATFCKDHASKYMTTVEFLIDHEINHIIRKHVLIGDVKITKSEHNLDNLIEDLLINQSLAKKYFIPRIGVNGVIEFSGTLKEEMSARMIINIAKRYYLVNEPGDADNKAFSGYLRIRYYLGKDNEKDDTVLKKRIKGFKKEIFREEEEEETELTGIPMLIPTEESIEELSAAVDEALQSIGKDGFSLAICEATDIARPLGYQKSKREWKGVLRGWTKKGLSTEEVYKTNVPNARIEGQFGRDVDERKIKTVVFAIDVSGSMSVDDYMFALSEIEAVIKELRIKKIKIIVVWWGTTIQEEKFSSYEGFKQRCKDKTPSLGGTDVNKCLEYIDNLKKVDLSFVFTDGCFVDTKPHKKNIIWCITEDGTDKRIKKTSRDRIVQPK